MYKVEFANPKKVTVYLNDCVSGNDEPFTIENVLSLKIGTKKYLGSYKYTLYKKTHKVELFGEKIVIE